MRRGEEDSASRKLCLFALFREDSYTSIVEFKNGPAPNAPVLEEVNDVEFLQRHGSNKLPVAG
jgi:hypothetical protein